MCQASTLGIRSRRENRQVLHPRCKHRVQVPGLMRCPLGAAIHPLTCLPGHQPWSRWRFLGRKYTAV